MVKTLPKQTGKEKLPNYTRKQQAICEPFNGVLGDSNLRQQTIPENGKNRSRAVQRGYRGKRSDFMKRLVINVVKKKYLFRIINSDLDYETVEVEAESPSAAVLLLPEGTKNWWLLEENQIVSTKEIKTIRKK